MKNTADVVVIGAGVIGCSTAYHLAQRGITDVVVLEMEQVGSGSSSQSASMLTLQFEPDELTIRMALFCYERYMQFEEEVGVPVDFRKTGWISLATEGKAAHLRENAALLQKLGVHTEVLSPDEIKARHPEINVEDIAVGTWGPDDGPFDPHMIMWGYVRRACEQGVRLHQGMRATGIRVRSGRVEGVETDKGFIATPVVVNAGGPWAVEIGGWIGVDIPIDNRARSVIVTGPLPDIPSDNPFIEDIGTEWYYRPEGKGILMGMGAWPTETMTPQTDYEKLDEMIEVAVHRVPVLEKSSILTTWTGLRPLTSDDWPIMGPVSGADGFVLNCGWGGKGIIMAPIAGQLVAEHIDIGRTESEDIRQLSIDRFIQTSGG
jgi:sarcosine oxidase subunit beta